MGADVEQYPDFAGSNSSSIRSGVSADTVKGILGLGVFGVPNDNPELLPLVDLWLDLSEHITAEEITDPREFLKKCAGVARYVEYDPLKFLQQLTTDTQDHRRGSSARSRPASS